MSERLIRCPGCRVWFEAAATGDVTCVVCGRSITEADRQASAAGAQAKPSDVERTSERDPIADDEDEV